MKRRTDRIVPSSCWEQLRTGKVWQRLSLALLVAVMTMTAQTARATDIVTQDNFDNYFDDNGNLLESITSDELIFQGEFSNSNNELVLTSPLFFFEPVQKTYQVCGKNTSAQCYFRTQ